MRNWETWVRSYLDLPVMTNRRDQRIVAELAMHVVEAWQDARARGATDDEADALVRARLGERQAAVRELLRAERHHAAPEVERRIERTEEDWRGRGRLWTPVADLIRELRLTLRSLGRSPAFTAATATGRPASALIRAPSARPFG